MRRRWEEEAKREKDPRIREVRQKAAKKKRSTRETVWRLEAKRESHFHLVRLYQLHQCFHGTSIFSTTATLQVHMRHLYSKSPSPQSTPVIQSSLSSPHNSSYSLYMCVLVAVPFSCSMKDAVTTCTHPSAAKQTSSFPPHFPRSSFFFYGDGNTQSHTKGDMHTT